MSDKEEIFNLIFIGEYVEIVTKLSQRKVQGDEDGVSDETLPLVLVGYVLDRDDEFLYMGDTPDQIVGGIKRCDISYIKIIQEQNPYDEIMDSTPDPQKGNMN